MDLRHSCVLCTISNGIVNCMTFICNLTKLYLALFCCHSNFQIHPQWIQQVFAHMQSFCSNLILFTDSKHELHSIDSMSKLQIQSKRLEMMSASLYTWTGLHCLTIQVLNTRLFIDVWGTSLTSVHNNLENGLAIVTESFSPLNLDYITSPCQSQNSKWHGKATLFLIVSICHVY